MSISSRRLSTSDILLIKHWLINFKNDEEAINEDIACTLDFLKRYKTPKRTIYSHKERLEDMREFYLSKYKEISLRVSFTFENKYM